MLEFIKSLEALHRVQWKIHSEPLNSFNNSDTKRLVYIAISWEAPTGAKVEFSKAFHNIPVEEAFAFACEAFFKTLWNGVTPAETKPPLLERANPVGDQGEVF
jgi:hypothetical protein